MTDNPFEPGASVLENADVGPSGFEPPATAVVMALYASAAIDAVQVPMAILVENVEENLMIWGVVGAAQIAVFILSVVLWCRWKMRAAKNIRLFTDHPFEFTPGWAVGWYFVPFANLVKPFQAMKEILAWSRPHSEDHFVADTSIVSAWWGGWIASNVLANMSTRVEAMPLSVAASVAGVIAAILAVRVVNAVNSSQMKAAQSLPMR